MKVYNVMGLLSAILILGVFACNNDRRVIDHTLPPRTSAAGPASCPADHIYSELLMCEWASSLDGIAIGYVTDVELIRSPAKIGLSGAGYVDAEDCDGSISPGLKLTLEVDTSIGDVPKGKIDIYIGQAHFINWSAYPVDDAHGVVRWRDKYQTTTPGRKIVPGQYLGIPLHFHRGENVWSPMGEQLFTVLDENDNLAKIQFQGRHRVGCDDAYPPEMHQMLMNDFLSKVDSCGQSTRSVERKDWVRRVWEVDKRAIAAGCSPRVDPGQLP